MPQNCSFLSDWVCPSSGSQSPASSTESYFLSPSYPHLGAHNEDFASYFQDPMMNTYHQTETSPPTGRRTRCKIIGPQRQSASEREKLRMRNLSKALHNLRRYLPPSFVPAGRNLTKIETLRMTISYISYLSKLLGCNEESLKQRKECHQEVDTEYLQIPEGYQGTTCRQYQQSQPQSQSCLYYEAPQQCEQVTVSPAEHEHTQMQVDPWVSSSIFCHRSQRSITDYSSASPYNSRLTHLY
ncbi:mesogenin-1-like [Gastrophryne carolinensis]